MTVSAGTAGSKTYQITNVSAGGTTLSTGTIQFAQDLSTNAGRDAAATAIANNIANGSAFAGANTFKANLKAPAGLAGNGTLTLTGGIVASGTAQFTVASGTSKTITSIK